MGCTGKMGDPNRNPKPNCEDKRGMNSRCNCLSPNLQKVKFKVIDYINDAKHLHEISVQGKRGATKFKF